MVRTTQAVSTQKSSDLLFFYKVIAAILSPKIVSKFLFHVPVGNVRN